MDNAEKIKLLEELFEVEENEISPDTNLEDLENWDSMMKLSLIVMMDDEFGKKLTANEMREFKTVKDVLDYME